MLGISRILIRAAEDLQPDNPILTALRGFFRSTGKDWNYILPEELHKNPQKYFILDVRRPEDFAKGHIPDATNIFWQTILEPENITKLPRDKKIVVACYVGHTSSQVMVALRLLGYDAVGLKFGMGISPDPAVKIKGWQDYGYEIEKTNG